MASDATNTPAQTLTVGPLIATSARTDLDRSKSNGWELGPDGAVDPVRSTWERPVFGHSVSWEEFGKDPNRYCAQFFSGNGNFCETGITASCPPLKDHKRDGYADVYTEIEYPATFKAGVSVFRTTAVEDRTVANSCCPHLPYLSYHRVREPGQPVFHNSKADQRRFEILNQADGGAIRNNLSEGTVSYTLTLRDRDSGHTLTQQVEKFASFADPQLACSRVELTADFAGDLIIVSGFDGTLINNLYGGYNQFQQEHTEKGPEGARAFDAQTVGLSLQTVKESAENLRKLEQSEYAENPLSTTPAEVRNQRQYQFGLAKNVRYFRADAGGAMVEIQPELLTAAAAGVEVADPEREAYVCAKISVQPGQRLVVEDRTALVSSIDRGAKTSEVLTAAHEKVRGRVGYEAAKEAHRAEWQRQFAQARICLFGGPRAMEFQAPLDLCRAALLRTVSAHNQHIAADMGAKGLHDGRYRTHNFWEMAILFWKVKAVQDPNAAKGLARLYIENIDSARAYAKSMGHAKGAQFGWQTTADGKPDTQVVKWNGVAQQWDPDFSKFQPHNNWAFFYGIDQIYRVSGDKTFLREAIPLLIELTRMAQDSCKKGPDGKFHTIGMMDPNEFNEKLPGATLPNLPDTFYNNFMIAKMALRLEELLRELPEPEQQQVLTDLGVTDQELQQIRALGTSMFFPITTKPSRAPLVDLSGNVRGTLDVPPGILENYSGFTSMPLVHWASMPEWLEKENAQRVAQGKKPIKPRFAEGGVIPRADQVLKAVDLRAKLAELVGDVLVAQGRWTKETNGNTVRFREQGSSAVVWKLDLSTDTVTREGSTQPLLNSPDNFQVGKQAASLQTVANFSAQEVVDLLRANGYAVDLELISRNVAYYDKHVNTNGSSLSNVGTGVGKISLGELKASLENYEEVLTLDAKDGEPGTSRQGFRAGNMAASDLMPLIYLGLEMNASRRELRIQPRIPRDIGGIELINAAYDGCRLFLSADGLQGRLRVRAEGLPEGQALTVAICGAPKSIPSGQTCEFEIPVSKE